LAEKLNEVVKNYENNTKNTKKKGKEKTPTNTNKKNEKNAIPVKKCPNTVPKKQPLQKSKISHQRMKSSTILSKTFNVNKVNLTTVFSKAPMKKSNSQQRKNETNNLNLENLKKLDSSTNEKKQKTTTNNCEISSMIVNPSETQSLIEDKNVANSANFDREHEDKSFFFNKNKKSVDNIKKNSNENIKEMKIEEKNNEVIVEETHLEESHIDQYSNEKRKMHDLDKLVENVLRCEGEMNERIEDFDEKLIEV